MFFDAGTETNAKEMLFQIGRWISQMVGKDMLKGLTPAFNPLAKWWDTMMKGWETLKNYFQFPVTSALAEGVNNVIKSLKRRAFGYRNMEYFKLKIMQVCGYLNSRFIKFPEQLGT